MGSKDSNSISRQIFVLSHLHLFGPCIHKVKENIPTAILAQLVICSNSRRAVGHILHLPHVCEWTY